MHAKISSKSTRDLVAARLRRAAPGLAAMAAACALLTGTPALALAASSHPAAPATAGRPAHPPLPSWSGYVRSTDGVRLWVHSVGGGTPGARVLVLVHGGPGLSLTYLSLFDQLATPSLQVVSYDQRGAGLSTAPADQNYGLAAQVSDLESVRRWAHAPRISIMGHSWGGIIAAAYTATHPGHVAALALLDAIPLNWAAFEAGETRISKRVTALQAEGLIPNPLPAVKHNSCLPVVEALTPAYLANPREHLNRARLWGGSCTSSTDNATFDAFYADRGQLPGLATALGQWPGRALVLQGADDPFGLQWSATSLAELGSATAQRVIVARAGHFPWVEQRCLVLRALRQFAR
jgi:proline iminopeptidase